MGQINDWNSLPRENIRGYIFIHTHAREEEARLFDKGAYSSHSLWRNTTATT